MTHPMLAPPGGGIPRAERAYGWVLVRAAAMCPVRMLLSKMERVSASLVELCPSGEGAGTRRVLVPRVMGIEDSSRFWSGAMILEHLTIVGRLVMPVITDLGQGRAPSLVLRTQDVKPVGAATRAETARIFESMVRDVVSRVRALGPGLSSRMRHQHPWFGPLRCRQWVAFVMLHHMVHLPQMRAIRAAADAGPGESASGPS